MIDFRENEEIYLIKRRHKVVLWGQVFPVLILFLIIIVLAILLFFSSLSWPNWLVEFSFAVTETSFELFLFFILSLLFLICWVFLFMIIAHYYLDCWIVTSERTIHTELKGLFNRVASTVQHDRIQDITVEIRGIVPTFLRYGDLYIQTAGGFRNFVCQQIPAPHETKEVIFKAQKLFLNKKNTNNYEQKDF